MRRGIKASSGTEYVRFDSRKCKACWKCIEACPEKVFGKINLIVHKHAKIVNVARCTGCRKCVKACDYGAISPIVDRNQAEDYAGRTGRGEHCPCPPQAGKDAQGRGVEDWLKV